MQARFIARPSRFVFAVLATAVVQAALAQTGGNAYPSRIITVIAPTLSGGSADTVLRQFIGPVSQTLGQQLVVVYKPGAGGTIGAEFVARSKPDGYTLVLGEGNFAAAVAMYKDLSYDPGKDFVPVSVLVNRAIMLSATPSLPVSNGKEYFEYARANPGKINFGVVSTNGELSLAAMHRLANARVEIVSYKGTAEMMPDLLTGRIHATAITMQSTIGFVRAGKLKALGIASAERSKLEPNLPTIAEQGVPGYTYTSWVGILAPAGTPKPIIDKLNAAFYAAAQNPELRQRYEKDFVDVLAGSPEQAAAFVQSDVDSWKSMRSTR